MTVGILEVEATAAPAGVDLAVCVAVRLAPVGKCLGLHPAEDGLELLVADVKREVETQTVPRRSGGIAPRVRIVGEVEGEALVDLHLGEVAATRLHPQAEDLGKEAGRGRLVLGGHDRVIQSNRHDPPPRIWPSDVCLLAGDSTAPGPRESNAPPLRDWATVR